jgi:hypothetical protein
VPDDAISLAQASAITRTGDLWLFRGYSAADRAIRLTTNSPVNHVGMAIAIDDLPPLMWHAELGRSLPDVWSGEHKRGAQLHDLSAAVTTWAVKYGQHAWLRPLEPPVTKDMEDAALRTVSRLDGTPFPSMASLAGGWLKSRARRRRRGNHAEDKAEAEATLETAYCAEIVATTYVAMGLLPADRPAGWYDPGRFWSGDRLQLLNGAKLGEEIVVRVDEVEQARRTERTQKPQ